MSMQPSSHPAPQRLAALAGADADALADRGLTAHVAGCDLCSRHVREMGALRAALAELPDLVPSRPLQLLPPVSAPARGGSWRAGLGRAFAPLVVAGMVLLLVGGVGATGALGPASVGALFDRMAVTAEAPAAVGPESTSTEAAAPVDQSPLGLEAAGPAASGRESDSVAAPAPSAGGSAEPATGGAGDTGESDAAREADEGILMTRTGWIIAGVVGAALLGLAFLLRRATQVR